MAALPITIDLDVYQGATFVKTFRWVDKDLTGWSARMQIRPDFGEPVVISLTTGSGITLAADGTITIRIEATASSAIDITKARYDLELVAPNGIDVTRFLQGKVKIYPEVTE